MNICSDDRRSCLHPAHSHQVLLVSSHEEVLYHRHTSLALKICYIYVEDKGAQYRALLNVKTCRLSVQTANDT